MIVDAHYSRCLAARTGASGEWLSEVTCDQEDRRQRWFIGNTGSGWLEIRADWGGRCVDTSDRTIGMVQLFDCDGRSSQRFRAPIRLTGETSFELASVSSGGTSCLEIGGGSLIDGAAALENRCNGLPQQRLYGVPYPGIVMHNQLVFQHSSFCLTRESSGVVDQSACGGADYRQVWRGYFAGDGHVFNDITGQLCLGVGLGGGADAVITQLSCTGKDNLRFRVR
jgi:hypothetical protein